MAVLPPSRPPHPLRGFIKTRHDFIRYIELEASKLDEEATNDVLELLRKTYPEDFKWELE